MDYQKEADARIVIDDLLPQAGWVPADKSMLETEVLVMKRGESGRDSVATPDDVSPSAGRYKPQIAEPPPRAIPRSSSARPSPWSAGSWPGWRSC